MSDATCKHPDGCPEPVRANGWCRRHYQRVRLTDEPGPVGLARMPAGATCTVDGCSEPNVARGYCEMHRWRVRYHGSPEPSKQRQAHTRKPPHAAICTVPDCGNPARTRGSAYCKMHYERVRRTGSPGPAGRLTRLPGEGHIDGKGYRRIHVPDGRRMMEHDYVMEQALGRRLLPGETVHHKNGLRADNDPGNLELWVVMQPRGQRVEDLVAFVAGRYPELLEARGWAKAA